MVAKIHLQWFHITKDLYIFIHINLFSTKGKYHFKSTCFNYCVRLAEESRKWNGEWEIITSEQYYFLFYIQQNS